MTFFGGTIADSGLLSAGSTGPEMDMGGWFGSLWSERRRDFIVVGVVAVEGRGSSLWWYHSAQLCLGLVAYCADFVQVTNERQEMSESDSKLGVLCSTSH